MAADMARMGIGVGIRYGLGRSPAAIANAAPPAKDDKGHIRLRRPPRTM